LNQKIKPQIKHMHDKKLSFVFLLHLINYKKFKSLKKRFLLSNFTLLKSFIPYVKYIFYYNHKRLWFSNMNVQCINFLSPTFFIKRMFGKQNSILGDFDGLNVKYLWQNGQLSYNLKKNKFYFKNQNNFDFVGSSIKISHLINFSSGMFFLKETKPHQTVDDMNMNMFFNVTLLNLIEIYSISIYCCLLYTDTLKN